MDLAKRLDSLEEKTELLAMQHDTFSRSTRVQLKQVFDALRELMTPPEPPKRPIGQSALSLPTNARRRSPPARSGRPPFS